MLKVQSLLSPQVSKVCPVSSKIIHIQTFSLYCRYSQEYSLSTFKVPSFKSTFLDSNMADFKKYFTCLMRLKSSLNSKAFTTHITDVGLLPSVGPHVVSQSSWTCELLWTHVTFVRLVSTVSELVLHQIK